MKKIIAILGFFVCSIGVSQAQEIGLRFGDNINEKDDIDFSIDGTIPFGKSRLHATIHLGDGFSTDILWDFFNKPLGDVSGLSWYLGAGGSTAIDDSFFVLGPSGEAGIEYHFDFPLAIGFDYRPTWWIIDDDTDLDFENYFGFNARFVIGK